MNAELTRSIASRTRLLAAACHDLRQPAHALGLLADVATSPSQADGGALMEAIRRSSHALSTLLDRLLDLTRFEEGRYTPVIANVPVAELFDELRVQFSPLARRKGLALAVQPCPGTVRTDRHLLQRILLNLLSNAIRYTEQGTVTLAATPEPGQVVLSVRDTGAGLPPDQQQAIFTDHVRLDRRHEHEGLGIGLPIAQRAASLLGTQLALASTVGQGSCFSLAVPRGDEVLAAPPATAPIADGAGHVIAVLEDDDDVRNATLHLLSAQGFVVVDAASIDGILRKLSEFGCVAPDVLVSDQHLGSASGLDLVHTLRQRAGWAGTRCALLTGDLSEDVAARARALGVALAYKPLPPRRLLELVESLLQRNDAAPARAQAAPA